MFAGVRVVMAQLNVIGLTGMCCSIHKIQLGSQSNSPITTFTFSTLLSLSLSNPLSSDSMFLVVYVSLIHSHSLTNSHTLMAQYSSHPLPLTAPPCQISCFCLYVISPAKSLGSDPFVASQIVFLIQFRPDKQNHAYATIFHIHR